MAPGFIHVSLKELEVFNNFFIILIKIYTKAGPGRLADFHVGPSDSSPRSSPNNLRKMLDGCTSLASIHRYTKGSYSIRGVTMGGLLSGFLQRNVGGAGSCH